MRQNLGVCLRQQNNVSEEQMNTGAGACWTWTAIDADTKLIISYML
jgi:hypothetical protein